MLRFGEARGRGCFATGDGLYRFYPALNSLMVSRPMTAISTASSARKPHISASWDGMVMASELPALRSLRWRAILYSCSRMDLRVHRESGGNFHEGNDNTALGMANPSSTVGDSPPKPRTASWAGAGNKIHIRPAPPDAVGSSRAAFADLTKTANGTELNSEDAEFLGIFNELFDFHDAEVLSSSFNLHKGQLDLLLNYILRWDLNKARGSYDLLWRELSLKFEGIFRAEFHHFDPKLGIPHSVNRLFDLQDLRERNPAALSDLTGTLLTDLVGSALEAITLRKLSDKAVWRGKFEVAFDWNTAPTVHSVTYQTLWCSTVRLVFATDASQERRQPWAPPRG